MKFFIVEHRTNDVDGGEEWGIVADSMVTAMKVWVEWMEDESMYGSPALIKRLVIRTMTKFERDKSERQIAEFREPFKQKFVDGGPGGELWYGSLGCGKVPEIR